MFGSGKPDGKPYDLITVLEIANGEAVETVDTHTFAERVKLLRVNRDDANVTYLPGVTEASLSELLAEKTKPVIKPVSKPVAKAEKSPTNGSAEDTGAVQEVSFELLQKVVMALSPDHAAALEPIWKENIVWPITNISIDNRYSFQGAMLIHQYSKQCPPKYDEEEVQKEIDSAKLRYRAPGEKRKQFGTLVKLLQQDNPEAYIEIFNKPRTDYASIKEEFEVNHFKVKNPLMYAEVDNDEQLVFRKRDEFYQVYENLFFAHESEGKSQASSFVSAWFKDPLLRTYDRVDFMPPPLTPSASVYNTYGGLKAANLPQTLATVDIQIPLQHILLLAGDTGEVGRDYLLNYLADLVQKPGKLPKVGLLFQSVQGCGKNVFFEEFIGRRILGPELMHCSANSEDYFGRFDNSSANRLLCINDEVAARDTAKVMSLIKASITSETIGLEQKNVKKIQLRNYTRWMYFTQQIQAMHLDNPERRWAIFQCDNRMAPGIASKEDYKTYFEALWAWIDVPDNVRGFYDVLMTRDISTWHPVNDRPVSRYYKQLQQMSMTKVEEWLVDMVTEDYLPGDWTKASKLLEDFLSFARRPNGTSHFKSPGSTTFGYELKTFLQKGLTHKMSNGSKYLFDKQKLHDTLVSQNKMSPLDFVDFTDE